MTVFGYPAVPKAPQLLVNSKAQEIRYNYIHDIEIIDTNTGVKVQAIYLYGDFSSTKVYGNIIKNLPSVYKR